MVNSIISVLKLFFLVGKTLVTSDNIYHESNDPMMCMTANNYFEAKGDGLSSMAGVTNNVYKRIKSPYYPNTVCEVVHQSKGGTCMYSWWCDGKLDIIDLSKPADRHAFIQAALVASAFLESEEPPELGMGDVLLYHSINVYPSWAKSNLTMYVGKMGSHLFYLESRSVALR
ncbi:MAG: cell wall hydrolase [Pseudomonadota bacterium]